MIVGTMLLCLIILGIMLGLVDCLDSEADRANETVDRDEYFLMTEELEGDK